MVVKVYISGISGNKEVKKRQQRVLMILDSKSIQYDVIDITEPGKEDVKEFMQNNSKSNGGTVSDPNPRSPLPPQLFNDDEYCGDYDQFDLANEVDTLEQFLKLEVPPEEPAQDENVTVQNGDAGKQSKETSQERDTTEDKPDEEDTNVKEKSASREGTPADRTASKEGSPAGDGDAQPEEAKEPSPVREKSVTKDESPAKEVEASELSKEKSPEKEEANENGTASSRHSEEKEIESEAIESKKDPSELLIESEQAVAAE